MIGLSTNPTDVRAIAPANRFPDADNVGSADDFDGACVGEDVGFDDAIEGSVDENEIG